MIDSRANRQTPKLLALCCMTGLAIVTMSSLHAQELFSEPNNPPIEQQGAPSPGGTGSSSQDPFLVDNNALGSSPITVTEEVLTNLNADSAGVLTPETGGFQSNLWAGTPRNQVETIMPELPAVTRSATVRAIMKRLLLSRVQPPEGDGSANNLVVARTAHLAAMADNKSLQDFLQTVPGKTDFPAIMRIEAEQQFLGGDYARGCSLTLTEIGRTPDVFWDKALVFCQILSGDAAKAELGASLMQEMGDQDAVFFILVAALTGTPEQTLAGQQDLSPLHLAMARVAGLALPESAIDTGNPATLRAIATNPNTPLPVRLRAAENAASFGALDVGVVLQLYAELSPSLLETNEDQFDRVEVATPGYEMRAGLYRQAAQATDAKVKAKIIAKAFDLSAQQGQFGIAAESFAPMIARMRPSPEIAILAPQAARALALTGRRDLANNWLQFVRTTDYSDLGRVKAMGIAMLLAVYLDHPIADGWFESDFSPWWLEVSSDLVFARAVPQMLGVLSAAGRVVPDEIWEEVLQSAELTTVTMPNPVQIRRLEIASQQNRTGETVMLSLLVLGTGGPVAADSTTLEPVMDALTKIGLGEEAYQMGLEAISGAGV